MKRILYVILCVCLILSSCTTEDLQSTESAETKTEDTAAPNTEALEELKIVFGDVGKADFILLSCGGEFAVIDTGYKKNSDYVENVLNDFGVKTIKFAVGTHPDKDHIGGMAKLMKKFKVNQLYISPLATDDSEYEKMISRAQEENVPITKAQIGDVLTLGGATLTTYCPNGDLLALNDENEASVVQMLEYGSFRMLFMADGQFICESTLLASEFDLSADVIKIAHHGSNKANSLQFLSKVGAKYAVISAADDDGEEFPDEGVIKTLASLNTDVYRTDRDGGIILTTNGNDINFEKGYGLQWTE